MTWKLSAFADEIGSDPELQFSTLENLGVGEIQLRGAWDKNVMELSTSELTELKSIASSHGLGFHGIGSPLGKLNISEDVQISIDGVRTAAAAAHAVGATRVRVFSFYYDSGVCPESIRTQVIDRLGSMLEVAEQSGVTLIHENEKDIYGDTGDRCLDLAVNLPALGHCFDFSNFVQCDEDTLECWNKLRDYVVYFDVKDAIAGSGVVCRQVRATVGSWRYSATRSAADMMIASTLSRIFRPVGSSEVQLHFSYSKLRLTR